MSANTISWKLLVSANFISVLDSNFSHRNKDEGLMNVTGVGGHVCYTSANISEMVRDNDIVTMDN